MLPSTNLRHSHNNDFASSTFIGPSSDNMSDDHPITQVQAEMERRSTNFGYGLGVALGRLIGTISSSSKKKFKNSDLVTNFEPSPVTSPNNNGDNYFSIEEIIKKIDSFWKTVSHFFVGRRIPAIVEQALATQDVAALQKLAEDPQAKDYINQKLKILLSGYEKTTDEEYQKVATLLDAGARPEHSIIPYAAYSRAIYGPDEKLLALLRTYQIKLDSKTISILKYTTMLFEEGFSRENPTLLQQICEITTSDKKDKIFKEIYQNYQFFSNEIDKAIIRARANHKPIMILIGEAHDSLYSALNQALILYIAAERLSLQQVLTEAFPTSSVKLDTNQLMDKLGKELNWSVATQMETLILDLIGRKIPVDHAVCPPDECKDLYALRSKLENYYSEFVNVAGVKNRNKVMADVALKSNAKDTIMIVGAMHLYGLLQETPLTDHYHVLTINSNDPNDCNSEKFIDEDNYFAVCNLFSCHSNEVVQSPPISFLQKKADVFITPDFLMKKAKEIHEFAKNTCLVTTDSSLTSLFKKECDFKIECTRSNGGSSRP